MASTAPPPDPPRLPMIEGFAILRTLGTGGHATVYLARPLAPEHTPLASEVAIKLAHRPGDPRLAREAELLGRLGAPSTSASTTATTPALLGQGMVDGRPFLILEYLGDDSLAARLAAGTRMAAAAAARLMAALCESVAHLHAAGIVHRDLKPQNILFRPGDRPVIIDLGLARLVRDPSAHEADLEPLTRTGALLGTYRYMAPEQCAGQTSIDARADVYALGVIAFELLAGRPPFLGNPVEVRRAHVEQRCPRPSEVAIGTAPDAVPRQLEDLVLRCLAKRPEARFDSAARLASAFARLARGDHAGEAGQQQPASTAAGQDSGPALLAPSTPEHASGVADPGLAGATDRPVVLLLLGTTAMALQLDELARAHDAIVVSAAAGGYVLALPWELSVPAAVRQAMRMAGELENLQSAAGASVVHVARLRVRTGKRGIRLVGSALARVHTWASPAEKSTGILLTAEAAHALGEEATVPAAPGFFRLASQGPRLLEIDSRLIPLRGRDDLLAALAAEVRACMAARVPVLSTIEGDMGMGKSRILHAHALALRSLGECRVAHARARPPREAEPDGLVRELLVAVLGLDADSPVTLDSLDAAWTALGAAPHEAGRWAVALLLGAVPATAPALAPILAAPGALRQAAARALALALTCAARHQPLCLLLDDMHWADHTSLDALELATMAGTQAPLAVWVAARPGLWSLRPRWGLRAATTSRHGVGPLDRAHASAMLLDLLRPAEFVPGPVLERLHELSGGVPVYLTELARAVREGGAIRRRGDTRRPESGPGPRSTPTPEPMVRTGGYYVAADELLRVMDMSVDEHLARRALEALPPALVPLAQLCAVLGDSITEADIRGIEAVLRARHGNAGLELDPAVALDRLCRADILKRVPQGHVLRHPLLRPAIVALIPAEWRRELHTAIMQHWQASGGGTRQSLAYHAARSGAMDLAATLHLELAGEAAASHRYVEAEEHYSRALDHLAERDPRRGPALAGRGSMRYRLQRLEDACADLRRGRALAAAQGSEAEIVALLLEEATVLDWCHEWASSAALAEEARPRALALGTPALVARAELALGRVLYRREQPGQSVAHLERAAAQAAAAGDHETHVIALLLLGPTLLHLDRMDAAGRCFDQAIELCTRAGDDFHRAVAHLNRQTLWFKRQEFDRVIADLEVAMDLGRQLGNAQFERAATFNLAEFLYWGGDLDRALELAQRARRLHLELMSDHPTYDDHLLIARILCSQGQSDARAYAHWVEEHCHLDSLPPSGRLLLALVRLALAALAGAAWDQPAWQALDHEAETSALFEERTEVMVLATELLWRRGEHAAARAWLARAQRVATRLWQSRLDALAARLGTA